MAASPKKPGPRSRLKANVASVAAPRQHREQSEPPRRRKSRKQLLKSRPRRKPPRRRLRRKSKVQHWRRLWVKKFIHTVFDSATTKTGTRTGLPSDSSASFCSKI